MSLLDKSISQLLTLMEINEVTSEELIRECILNIEAQKEDLYKLLLKEEALKRSKEIDEKRKNKEALGSLAGIPFFITDDISTKGITTSAGSRVLANYIPPFNASVIENLLAEDAIIIAKLKVSEFGLSLNKAASEALSHKGACFAISTNQDSSKLSMKTSFGMISRYGIIGATSSFDQVVPITNSVEDLAAVLNTIVGYDKKDSTSIKRDKIDYSEGLNGHIEGMKIAIPREILSGEGHKAIDELCKILEKLGAIVQDVSLESLDFIPAVYEVLSSAEFASTTARYDGISLGYRASGYMDREDLYKRTRSEAFSKEAKKKILFGNYVISSDQYDKYYKKSQRVRKIIQDEFTKVTDEYDFLILPFSEPFNLVARVTGLPSITIAEGIQVLGAQFKEKDLLRLAYTIEEFIKEVETND